MKTGRKGLMFCIPILHTIAQGILYFLSITGFCAGPNSEIEDFFKYLDPENTSGSIVAANRNILYNTNITRIITIYTWDRGDFLAEIGIADDKDQFSIKKLLSASGKWRGTNWSYYPNRKSLNYIIKLSKDQSEFVEGLSGYFPDEARFLAIIGRGVIITEFKSFERQGNIVKGFIQQKRVPITGNVERKGDEYIFVYKYEDLDIARSNVVRLKEYDSGTYIPTSLTIYLIKDGTIVLENDYVVLAVTNKPVKTILSPFILYKDNIENIFEQVGEKLYCVKNGIRTELPGKSHRFNEVPIFNDPIKNTLLLIGLIIFMSIMVLMLWIFLKARGKS